MVPTRVIISNILDILTNGHRLRGDSRSKRYLCEHTCKVKHLSWTWVEQNMHRCDRNNKLLQISKIMTILTWQNKLRTFKKSDNILAWNGSTRMGEKVKEWIRVIGGSSAIDCAHHNPIKLIQPWILTHKDSQGKEILAKASCASRKSTCYAKVRYGRYTQKSYKFKDFVHRIHK